MLASFLNTGGATLYHGGSTLGPERLAWLALVVFVGAVAPVIPTGAAVSATAVLAGHQPLRLLVVLACGAAGAWAGDVVTLLLLERGGGRVLGRLVERTRRSGSRAARVGDQLQVHDLRVLVVSRLIPGARVPVLLAAAGGALDRRRYVLHDLTACAVWSATYAAIGVAGGAVSGSPVVAIGVAVLVILTTSVAVSRIENARRRRAPGRDAPPG